MRSRGGVNGRIRTDDLLFKNPTLFVLFYPIRYGIRTSRSPPPTSIVSAIPCCAVPC